jgi:hypothetical protein
MLELHGSPPNVDEILGFGYPSFDKDRDDPSILLVSREGVWRHVSGIFVKLSRPFYAIGSGRDYALAAMSLGCDSERAVRVASEFDNNTNNDVRRWILTETIDWEPIMHLTY